MAELKSPFTGNGMTAARNGVIVSEYHTAVVAFKTAQMIDVYPDGSQKLKAVYDADQGIFIKVEEIENEHAR